MTKNASSLGRHTSGSSSGGIANAKKKDSSYPLSVDKDDKATEFRLFSLARPHMRAFQCAAWGYFIAFFIWNAIPPLLPVIAPQLGLSTDELWTSQITSEIAPILLPFLLEGLCDSWGAKTVFSLALLGAAIPAGLVALVESSTMFSAVRFFIGIAGGTSVIYEYWMNRMFCDELVNMAEPLVAGWGSVGSGVSQLAVGGLWQTMQYYSSSWASWRITVGILPAVLGLLAAIIIYTGSDDAPTGNYRDLKKTGQKPDTGDYSFRQAASNRNMWILFIQFGCAQGVELCMDVTAALYYVEVFGLSISSAAFIASIVGLTGLFALYLGSVVSDKMYNAIGMRGRLITQSVCLVVQGALVLVFNQQTSLGPSIATLTVFSLFMQAAEGSTNGLISYVQPTNTRAISSIVNIGGNVMGVLFCVAFRQRSYTFAFNVMGGCVVASAILSFFLSMKDDPAEIDSNGNDDKTNHDNSNEPDIQIEPDIEVDIAV